MTSVMHLTVRLVISLALIFAPWAFGATEKWSIQILEILCLLAALLFIIGQSGSRGFILRQHTAWILCLSFIGLIGIQLCNPLQLKTVVPASVYELVGGSRAWPHTIQWQATFANGIRWSCILLLGFVLLHHVQTRADLQFFIKLLILNATLLSLEAILQYLSGTNKLLGFRTSQHPIIVFGPFVCRNNFAAYANLCIPLALAKALLPDMAGQPDTSKRAERFFWTFCAMLVFAAVFLSSSRAGIIVAILMIGAVALDFTFRRRGRANRGRWGFLMLAGFLGVGLVVLVGGLVPLWERLQESSLGDPLRVAVWKATLDAIADSPWWGYGLATFSHLFPFYRPTEISFFYEYAHNDWLEAIFDFGIVGFSLLVTIPALVMISLARERIMRTSTFRRSVAGAAFVSLAGCVIHAWVDFPLHIAAVQVTFVAITALGLSARYIPAENSHSSGSGP